MRENNELSFKEVIEEYNLEGGAVELIDLLTNEIIEITEEEFKKIIKENSDE